MGVIIDSITQCRFASLEEVRKAARPDLEWFQHVISAINDGIWDWDIVTGKSYCNQAYFRMLGYEPAETVTTQDGWLDLLHPGDLQSAWEANQDCIEGVTSEFEIEFRMRHTDGSWRWIKSRGKCTERGVDGRALHIVGTHTDITEVRRGEMIQAALYQISEAAHSVADLDELYRRIHGIIGGLMEASNFYIALYDETAGLLCFPYCVDELDPTPPPQKLGHGMTEYVLRSGQPLLASPEVYSHLIETGAIQIIGAPSVDWLGVPLKTPDGKTFGMMALQTYTQQVRYTQSDQDVLVFISAQVASAILRKRAEEHILKLNNTLHSISQVNQILVRAADESELMQRVCQALVDTAHYPLAWIGLYQHDAARTVRPAVIAGSDGGMLADDSPHLVGKRFSFSPDWLTGPFWRARAAPAPGFYPTAYSIRRDRRRLRLCRFDHPAARRRWKTLWRGLCLRHCRGCVQYGRGNPA